MDAHLQSGCDACASIRAWMTTVRDVAAQAMDVPPELIAQAKSAFRPRTLTAGVFEGLQKMLADLVLVSTGDFLPLGVRAGSAAGERHLFRAGDYSVDVTMSNGLAMGEPGEMIGQISSAEGEFPVLGTVVQIRSRGRVLGETETNQFGEFFLHRPTSQAASLHFALVPAGQEIEVRLKGGRKKNT